jgi:peptide deformylase
VAVRPVVIYPDARLKQVCEPVLDLAAAAGTHPPADALGVPPLDDDALALARDLVETMASFPGCVGIAAPQVGALVRMVAIDVRGHRKARSCAGLVVLVDPVVTSTAGSVTMREGCLSVPDFTGNVRRVAELTVRARVLRAAIAGPGATAEVADAGILDLPCDAYEARVVLHELDHLDGILFLDRVDSARDIFPRKVYQ